VGENQPEIRNRVARRLTWLGVELDDTANDSNDTHQHVSEQD
jgi:acetate kinase